MAQITQMDLIKADIEYHAQGASNKSITQNILKEWRDSQTIIDMQEADAYYKVQNTAIEEKTRSYTDEEGNLILNENASNIKTRTAQYRKSVNQKVDFALSKPFIISCNNDNYKEVWENFLTEEIRDVITRTGLAGINKGIGWSYPWIDEQGQLKIVDTPSETLYPAWHDIAHTLLDFMVRDFVVKAYDENMEAADIYKVEFWDDKIVEKYIDNSQGAPGGDLSPDVEDDLDLSEAEIERATIQQTHMKASDGSGVSWDRVPFIAFKGCTDELPLLNECKDDIDGYDMIKSKSLDSIVDDIDATVVVEGISPEMGELTKARKMIQNSRILSLDMGGKAYVLKVDTDVTKIAQELEIIRKDIQDNTNTVDLTTIQLGTNPSGKSMRTFYESLNVWCNGFEKQFRVYMKQLKYFFDKWLSWAGGYGTFEELQAIDITFTLDRDMMIDETEIIDNIVKLDGKISQETLDEMNPYVESHEKEERRREEDRKKEQEQSAMYDFANDLEQNEEVDENEPS